METTLRYLGGKKFEAIVRGHRLVSDQPPENHGGDSGMTPPELFLSSLAACAGYYAAEYLNTRNLPSDGLEIRVSATKGEKPARLGSIRIEVTAPGLDARHREGILRAVDACLLANTLRVPPKIELTIAAPSPVEALVS